MLRVGGNPAMTDLSDELPYFLFVPLIELTHQTIGQEELRIRIASALQMWLFDQAAPRIQERGMILSSTFQQQNKAIERWRRCFWVMEDRSQEILLKVRDIGEAD